MSQHSSKGAGWDELRLSILDRDGWVCQLCGKELVGSDAHADHIVPKRPPFNGTDDPANLRAACADCNKRRNGEDDLVRETWLSPRWFATY